MQPENCFKLFFDEDVFSFVIDMSNLYPMQEKGDASFKTSPEELKCWLGIMISTS